MSDAPTDSPAPPYRVEVASPQLAATFNAFHPGSSTPSSNSSPDLSLVTRTGSASRCATTSPASTAPDAATTASCSASTTRTTPSLSSESTTVPTPIAPN